MSALSDTLSKRSVECWVEMSLAGSGTIVQEVVSAFPGVDEAMGFAELMQNVQTMPYSVIYGPGTWDAVPLPIANNSNNSIEHA